MARKCTTETIPLGMAGPLPSTYPQKANVPISREGAFDSHLLPQLHLHTKWGLTSLVGPFGWTEPGCGAHGPHTAGKAPTPDPVSHPSLADPGLALAGLHATSAPAQSFPRLDKPGQRGEKSVLSLGTTGALVTQGSCQLARPCPS